MHDKFWKAVDTVRFLETRPERVTFYREEDRDAWIMFTAAFVVLLIVDLCVVSRRQNRTSIGLAAGVTVFWVLCAGCFNVYVYTRFGHDAAFSWTSAYMLEWLLSFDNLFVFHSIFSVYKTPEELRMKVLSYGIWGAVVMRLVFLFLGEFLMHAVWFAHLAFGFFLIYTGVRAVAEDEEEDPSQLWMVKTVTKWLPFVSYYDRDGAFFIRVPVDRNGLAVQDSKDEHAPLAADVESYGSVEKEQHHATRATLLFLVLLCLEVCDLAFAIDSVSAVVAQVTDLFLAYSAVAFAMLGLRAAFFVVDALAHTFALFKYGIACVLVFIGLKLVLTRVIYFPPLLVVIVLLGTLAASVVLSVVQERLAKKVLLAAARSPRTKAREEA